MRQVNDVTRAGYPEPIEAVRQVFDGIAAYHAIGFQTRAGAACVRVPDRGRASVTTLTVGTVSSEGIIGFVGSGVRFILAA